MKQQTFTDIEYNQRKKKTRREEFLDAMNTIIPWSAWIEMIVPFDLSGKRGRPVKGITTMLRMYPMQIWFNNAIVQFLRFAHNTPLLSSPPPGKDISIISHRAHCLIIFSTALAK